MVLFTEHRVKDKSLRSWGAMTVLPASLKGGADTGAHSAVMHRGATGSGLSLWVATG